MQKKVSHYYRLTKPGIVYGNSLHLIAGALLAIPVSFNITSFLATLLGTGLLIASACVANNMLDRDIDVKMKRTKNRPSVTGEVSLKQALWFSAVLFLIGAALIVALASIIVFVLGVVAYIFYVVVYGYAKRKTIHSTLIGSIPGALPAMAGYVGASGMLGWQAWTIFILVVLWQMPHFYAISVFRSREYAAASIPVMGVLRPAHVVQRYMVAYQTLYVICIALMIAFGPFGIIGGMVLATVAIYWLLRTAQAFEKPVAWARNSFKISLLVSLIFLGASFASVVLP